MKTVSIFGATGTVGQKALSLIAGTPGQYRVHTLAAGRDAAGLAAAARNAGARRAVLADAAHYSALKEHLSGTGIEAAAGQQALLEAAAEPVDVGVAAIVGVAGLAPTLVQAANAKVLALANKESVVCAGALLRDIVSSSGNQLIPVDSEHNALFQLLRGMGQDNTLRKITLTASGGPFRTRPLNTFASITPAEAARHPIWTMGQKISVDSATLMNKALEVIEAHFLFDIPPQQIEVLVHPQAAVNAIAHYTDGSSFAHVSVADMVVPLAFALRYPQRFSGAAASLDLTQYPDGLQFTAPDAARYPCLHLAYAAMDKGLAACITLNAANEVAVAAFLKGRIPFTAIAELCASSLADASNGAIYSIDDVFAEDARARAVTEECISRLNKRAG